MTQLPMFIEVPPAFEFDEKRGLFKLTIFLSVEEGEPVPCVPIYIPPQVWTTARTRAEDAFEFYHTWLASQAVATVTVAPLDEAS